MAEKKKVTKQMSDNLTVGKWLRHQYLDWQQHRGDVYTLSEFAEFLGVKRAALSMHMSDKRVPTKEFVDLYADKLQNDEIYDIMGWQRPNADLRKITRAWDDLKPATRQRILSMIDAEVSD